MTRAPKAGPSPGAARCNILGPTALGFRHRDDVTEITRLLEKVGVDVAVVAPLGASAAELSHLGDADFNVVLYPEIAQTTADWLKRRYGQPFTTKVPIGVGATRDFVREVATLAGLDPDEASRDIDARSSWYSRSVDSTYLTGKRVFIFGDATHVLAAARIATEELGFTVVGLGTYTRERARDVRAAAEKLGVTALITDDYLLVEKAIAEAAPELVLGTQMERHIAKKLGVPCAVISAPMHVQDVPARYSPQMGLEGANVLFDSWVHPLMMGLEEHLLHMFRDDFEFHDGAAPSHLAEDGSRQSAVVSELAVDSRARRVERRRKRCRLPADCRPPTADSSRMVPRGREGTQEDPLLRPRQGEAEHRELRRWSTRCRRSRSTPCTTPRRTMAGKAPVTVRMVLVTLDAHLADAFARARQALARDLPGLELRLHIAADWSTDPAAAERCRADLRAADLVAVTQIFVEEMAAEILPVLREHQARYSAILCALCTSELVKLHPAGQVLHGRREPEPLVADDAPAEAARRWQEGQPVERRAADAGASHDAEAAQVHPGGRAGPARVPALPAVLARGHRRQHRQPRAPAREPVCHRPRWEGARAADRAGARGLPGGGRVPPDLPNRGMAETVDVLPRRGTVGTVGVLVGRSYLLAGNTAHYDAVIRGLEAQGLSVIAAFASALDARPAIDRFMRDASGMSHDRRPGIAHRLLPGGRPGVQRSRRGAGGAHGARRAVPLAADTRVPDDRGVGRRCARAQPVAGDAAGGDAGTRRRDWFTGLRRQAAGTPWVQ